jgi:hypothetical protein
MPQCLMPQYLMPQCLMPQYLLPQCLMPQYLMLGRQIGLWTPYLMDSQRT